jgi:hypothetical protein
MKLLNQGFLMVMLKSSLRKLNQGFLMVMLKSSLKKLNQGFLMVMLKSLLKKLNQVFLLCWSRHFAPLVEITTLSFPYSWLITKFVTRVTRTTDATSGAGTTYVFCGVRVAHLRFYHYHWVDTSASFSKGPPKAHSSQVCWQMIIIFLNMFTIGFWKSNTEGKFLFFKGWFRYLELRYLYFDHSCLLLSSYLFSVTNLSGTLNILSFQKNAVLWYGGVVE